MTPHQKVISALKAGRMAMHACQIKPTDTVRLDQDCLTGPTLEQGGTLWGRQPFCPHFSISYSLVR